MMKQTLILAAGMMIAFATHATLYSTNWSSDFMNGTLIPDNNFSGWSDERTVETIPAGAFTSLSVDLEITGGWNGDLYAYLVHDSGFCVLLDRVGTGESGVGAYGYGDSGMDVTLVASGTSIHQYGGSSTFSAPPTSTWMTDNTSGNLGSFLSTDPNGTWSLFIADMSPGGVSTVQSWGLQMEIVPVPEVETWVAAAVAGAFGAFWLNRQIWSGVKKSES